MQERFSSSVIFLSWLCCVPSCCTVGEYQCRVVTGTQADMLSHCDEKHSEMMWRECSSCPQRDVKLALAFVYFFIFLRYVRVSIRVLVCFSVDALVIVCTFSLAFKPISFYTVWLLFHLQFSMWKNYI